MLYVFKKSMLNLPDCIMFCSEVVRMSNHYEFQVTDKEVEQNESKQGDTYVV